MVRPDLVVYLRADTTTLLERIAHRGRSYEATIDADYLTRITHAYDEHFGHVPYPVYVVNAADVDFVRRVPDRLAIVRDVLRLARAA